MTWDIGRSSNGSNKSEDQIIHLSIFRLQIDQKTSVVWFELILIATNDVRLLKSASFADRVDASSPTVVHIVFAMPPSRLRSGLGDLSHAPTPKPSYYMSLDEPRSFGGARRIQTLCPLP